MNRSLLWPCGLDWGKGLPVTWLKLVSEHEALPLWYSGSHLDVPDLINVAGVHQSLYSL